MAPKAKEPTEAAAQNTKTGHTTFRRVRGSRIRRERAFRITTLIETFLKVSDRDCDMLS